MRHGGFSLKMLRSLVELKLPSNFLIIKDTEFAIGQDVYIAFLRNWAFDTSIKGINLICYENPPAFYLPKEEMKSEKIVAHDFFTDPCGWNNSIPVQHLHSFTSNPENLSKNVIFIDSLSTLAYLQGFFSMCKDLSILKNYCKSIVCIAHADLFSPEQLEELSFYASTCIEFEHFSCERSCKERICEVIHKKPGGKVIKQKEFFLVSPEFNVSSRISQRKTAESTDVKKDIESLSTFKLGLQISEKEKKARDELVLPYLKKVDSNKTGEIFYQPQADDLEDDPDDDLDI